MGLSVYVALMDSSHLQQLASSLNTSDFCSFGIREFNFSKWKTTTQLDLESTTTRPTPLFLPDALDSFSPRPQLWNNCCDVQTV